MKTVAEYRQHAEECRALARSLNGEHREQLLRMAETWDRLAEQNERREPTKAPELAQTDN